MRTTASWAESFPHVTSLLGMTAGSRVWLPGPLTSTMNLFAAVHAGDLGAGLQSEPGGATHAVLTPAVLARSLAQGVDLSGVHVLVAGDRLSRALHDRAQLGGVSRVSHYYGAAELSFVAWGSHALDLRPFPGVEVTCRDGVLWVRSPYVCIGYDGPGGTLRRGSDGFVTVGDRGRLDDAFLRVDGRGDQAIVTAGATVLVADVEAALEAATGHRVVVVGLPHPDLGQVVCGVVGDATHLAVVRDAARDLLEPGQRPRRWFDVAEIPLTDGGKPDRRQLVRQLQERPS